MIEDNIILATDSYKLGHYQQYPKDTEAVYSYFESRPGAKFDYTVFFGLQSILRRYLEGQVVTQQGITEAATLAGIHFGNNFIFNYEGWQHILDDHGGCLPLRIKAVPEGTCVPTGNVLMTVENTCPKCYWLTNAVESLLTHVWYPSTVATLSRTTKEAMWHYVSEEARGGLDFMLHDFGYRGASSHETAALGGAAHLVNFLGTDTLPGMQLAINEYGADRNTLAFSVPATEHSVMTSLGEEGEFQIVEQLLDRYPEGIVSCVADSYDIYRFVNIIGKNYAERILARDGKFVVRPDSITKTHETPEELMVWIVDTLYEWFGGTENSEGLKVLDPHIGVLWGDGIDPEGIEKILAALWAAGYAGENAVFGMGGGLLQKVNRDTQRFAFKSSAQKRSGEWHDVFKNPLDSSKASKKGRLSLWQNIYTGEYETIPYDPARDNSLVTVFENGYLLNEQTFDKIRERAALTGAVTV